MKSRGRNVAKDNLPATLSPVARDTGWPASHPWLQSTTLYFIHGSLLDWRRYCMKCGKNVDLYILTQFWWIVDIYFASGDIFPIYLLFQFQIMLIFGLNILSTEWWNSSNLKNNAAKNKWKIKFIFNQGKGVWLWCHFIATKLDGVGPTCYIQMNSVPPSTDTNGVAKELIKYGGFDM